MTSANYSALSKGLQAQNFPEQQIVGAPGSVAKSCVPAFQLSVLTNNKKLLTKTIFADGTVKPSYAMYFYYTYHVIETLEELVRVLQWLATKPHRCMVRGQLRAELNASVMHRRLIKPSYNRWTNKIDQPTIECPLRPWLVLDIDGVRVPVGLGAPDKLAEAGYYIRDSILPSIFRGIECVASATSKTGLMGDDIAYLRLFFMLGEAADNDLLRVWLEKLNLQYPFVDPSVCDPEHIIYTARPKFVGCDDPVPEWSRVRLLEGYEETISPELPRVRVRKKSSGTWHPAPLTTSQVDWSDVSPDYLDLCEKYAGLGVHGIEQTSDKAWTAIRRMFEMLNGCPKPGCDRERGGSRHYTLTAVAYELACLVTECELTRHMALKAYLTAARGIHHTANGIVYDKEAIHRRCRDAFNDVGVRV